jgi:tetratricopeptide (TPR) repeat protein
MTASPRRRPGRPRAAEFTTPLTIPGGAVAGAELVRELPTDVSLAVWQTLRSVLLWAAEEPALRGDLFEPWAMGEWERELLEDDWDPDVRCALAVLVGQLARLGEASPETLAHTCLSVTDWALEHGYVATGLAFAEAAGLAWPQHPRFAWVAGRLMRVHGRRREAEMWLKRSERAAARMEDWDARSLALNSLGNAHYEAGNYQASIRTLMDALRVARRYRLRQREGEILHDLFNVLMWSGDLDRAEPFAVEAFEIYKDGHHRLASLAHDMALLWIKRGYFGRALTVLRELPIFFDRPEDRVRVLASLARAAGECGDSNLFDTAATESIALAQDDFVARHAAPAMLEIGLGAWSLGDWLRAETALENAIRLGGQMGERDVVEKAEVAMAAINARMSSDSQRTRTEVRGRAADEALVSGFLTRLYPGRDFAAA